MTLLRVPSLLLIVSLPLLAPGFGSVHAATATVEPAPPKAAPPMTVTDTVTQVIASEELQRAALARLEQTAHGRDLAQRVTVMETDLDALAARATAKGETISPLDLDRQLREMQRAAAAAIDDLGSTVRRLEHDGNALESEARKWQERRQFLEAQLVPAAVLDSARSTELKLQGASARVREFRDSALLALDRAVALNERIHGARELVAIRQARARAYRMELEKSPIWRLAAAPAQAEEVAAELLVSWRVVRDYLQQQGARLAGLCLAVLVLTGWLFTRGRQHDDPPAQLAYGRPLAASLLIALMALWWLAPDPPVLFYEALLMLAPFPAARVLGLALPAPIPLTLYGIALSTVLLSVRHGIEASVIADRLLLLLQAISIGVPVAIDLRRGRLPQALPRISAGAVRGVAWLAIAGSAVTGLSVIFGFVAPVGSVRAGMGSVLGFAMVFGTTALALYGATLALLASPVAQWLHSARNADQALLRTVRLVLAVVAIVGVMLVSLGALGLIPFLRSAVDSLMDATLEVGSVSIAAKAVAIALAVVFATIVLTGVTGFILDREIMPRLHLRPGTGFAVVTFTRWSMIIIGATLTLAALGIDMAKVTLLAGALSVGIGFGLQNVVNNFVSGLILIVERPIGVGDAIEWGSQSGTVSHIGIRSSTVRTKQGAEVIVPNGDLVAKEVVNWTRSDRQRRYDIDVGVAAGSDPEQVICLLEEVAQEVPEIMTVPAPQVIFKGFGDSSLNFTLLAWVPTVDVGLKAQNALRTTILRKLNGAGIAVLPFPVT